MRDFDLIFSPNYPPENQEDEEEYNKDEIDEAELDINKIEDEIKEITFPKFVKSTLDNHITKCN